MRIVIPKYIRQVKLSEKQRAIYYKYINHTQTFEPDIPNNFLTKEGQREKILNNGRVYVKDLKPNYAIQVERDTKDKDYPYFYLYDKTTNTKVIANPKKVGTPRLKIINAQGIYSGDTASFEKENIMMAIKKSFAPYLQHVPKVEKYPVRVRLYLYDTVNGGIGNKFKEDTAGIRWDLINRSYMYSKAFCDLLVEGLKDKSVHINKILKDDERLYVTEDGGAIFMPIDKPDKRRLVFVVEPDDENFNNKIKDLEDEHVYLIKNNKFYKNLNN